MAKPILRAEDCARIHAASLEALETVGVSVDDAAVISAKAGVQKYDAK